jgi:hypothetical protein
VHAVRCRQGSQSKHERTRDHRRVELSRRCCWAASCSPEVGCSSSWWASSSGFAASCGSREEACGQSERKSRPSPSRQPRHPARTQWLRPRFLCPKVPRQPFPSLRPGSAAVRTRPCWTWPCPGPCVAAPMRAHGTVPPALPALWYRGAAARKVLASRTRTREKARGRRTRPDRRQAGRPPAVCAGIMPEPRLLLLLPRRSAMPSVGSRVKSRVQSAVRSGLQSADTSAE